MFLDFFAGCYHFEIYRLEIHLYCFRMSLQVISTILFACAILHTFLASKLTHYSHSLKKDSFLRGLTHLLGEVEVVFGLWAGIFVIYMSFADKPQAAIDYIEKLKFTEPLFVFVVMVVCASRPILDSARELMQFISSMINRIFKVPAIHADVFVMLTLGPLLGSFITEPAAMTVVALLMRSMIVNVKPRVLYFLLALMFVNVSVGGAMTPFAAPPILMVAKKWDWGLSFTLARFAHDSILICVVNALLFLAVFRKEIKCGMKPLKTLEKNQDSSWGVQFMHLFFLALIVMTNHHSNLFMAIFLFFLGVTAASKKYQDPLRFRESLLVAFFLGGLMVFGEFQHWWLQPLLSKLSDTALFFGATGLTSITDNAALTYLGSQVDGLTEASRFALVAGALAGGGLTVLANAPNPAGFSIMSPKFPDGAINHLKLMAAAIIPSCVAILFLWLV